ncbi:M48 family metalloprotease [Oscillatoria sp. FACHB-1407]|uniref:M48 family metallopeptidase n=1 Tax=Oscillatoria sp. FACHB-1407 TaxID=2692847 RepID=UPI00168820A3|nr:M48 family metallopeptidase [Oscillatoria sp. FACHB-1407]MBD2461200.1 M48 family metalloprotease [Oscillatoria sp. FACHB-1407]
MSNLLSQLYRQIRRRWIYGFMSLIVALGVVTATPQSSQAIPWLDLIIRGVQVIQLSNLSDRQEVALGGQINQQLVSREFRLYNNRAVTDYVNNIGQRLVPHSDRPNIPYVFQVVDDNQVNAFATMGGYVYVTTGLMRTADNEAQLASVIGHEIGHIAGRHAVEQMRQTAIAQGVVTAAGLDRSTAVNIGVELALRRPNSRQDELEADTTGLSTLTRAGYAPSAMVAFMQKLMGQSAIPSFLSTHPATRDRIRALERQIDPATANNGIGLDNTAYRNQIQPVVRR